MIPKSTVLTALAPGFMKPKPIQSQTQTQIQKQDQNQSQAQNVEVKIFPNVTEYKPEEKVDDGLVNELKNTCNYQQCVIEVYDKITELMKGDEMIISESDLKFIIKNLSSCDDVDIQYEDGGCLGICSRTVDKIHLIYGGELYNMKYSSESLINFLKNKNISWRRVR